MTDPKPTTGSDEDARAKIAKARDALRRLCEGAERFTMSIPARPSYDHDLIFADAFDAAIAALDAHRALKADGKTCKRCGHTFDDHFDESPHGPPSCTACDCPGPVDEARPALRRLWPNAPRVTAERLEDEGFPCAVDEAREDRERKMAEPKALDLADEVQDFVRWSRGRDIMQLSESAYGMFESVIAALRAKATTEEKR